MKLFKYFLAVAAIASMASCSDDIVSPEGAVEVPDELTITLNVPDYLKQEVGTRAAGDVVYCICQDAAGGYLSKSSGILQSDKKVTFALDPKTVKVQLVMNHDVDKKTADLSQVTFSAENENIMWGKADLKDLIANPSVTMLRSAAKVAVRTTDRKLKDVQFAIYGAPDCGTLAPALGNMHPTLSNVVKAPTVPSEVNYNKNSDDFSSASKVIFESAPTEFKNDIPTTKLIVRAKYNEDEEYSFYVMAIAKLDTLIKNEDERYWEHETPGAFNYEALPILRNHYYDVVIDEVHCAGWRSLDEALKAPADNRMTYRIDDTNEGVNSITANADYMLGVQDAVVASAATTSVNVTIVSSYPGTPRLSFSANEEDEKWIHVGSIDPKNPTTNDNISDGRCKKGYVYNVSVDLEANTNQSPRTGTVTVRSGQLTRTFTITQEARDYVRDPDRPVTAVIGGTTITNYFDWISNTVKGTDKEAFADGTSRDDGFIFSAVEGNTIQYKIPVLAGDKSYSITQNSNFKVSKSGNYYVVTWGGSSSPSVETGELTVVTSNNSSNISIKYPLYRTGILHQLTSAHTSVQRPDGAVTGWYYYELVKVGGKWTLDRNLGATSNHPYISTAASTLSHIGAVGGYFKISTEKSSSIDSPKTILSSLSLPSGFDIPKRADLEAMGIQAVNIGTGEAIVVATATTQSPSKLAKIYFPHGGYYEDRDLRYETHANLWTKTLVAGNQGFSVGSPDFGYWYQYFDCYTSKTGFSNMRFFDGSTGEAPTEESAYKYLPIRLVFN